MYGEVPGVIEKGGYFTNSFHTNVRIDINPIDKMYIESKFWNYSNGGKISHISLPDLTNDEGIISLIRYGMSRGLYLGVNHKADYCLHCGNHFIGDDSTKEESVCPECGSNDIVKIRRM